MHPQPKPKVFKENAANIREKIAEQQRLLALGTLHSTKQLGPGMPAESQRNNKSFAKYLNEMLESQNGNGVILNSSKAASKTTQSNFFDHEKMSIPQKGGAFLSQGKGSISGTRVH